MFGIEVVHKVLGGTFQSSKNDLNGVYLILPSGTTIKSKFVGLIDI